MRRQLQGSENRLARMLALSQMSPAERLITELGDVAASYIEKNQQDKANEESRSQLVRAMSLMAGRPQETEKLQSGDEIRWNAVQPNFNAAIEEAPPEFLAPLYEGEQKRRETEAAYNRILERDKINYDRDMALEDRSYQHQKEMADYKGSLAMKLAEFEAQKGPDPEKLVGIEKDLRKEYYDKSKTFDELTRNIGKIEASATTPEPTGASDMALVFNYMKMLDPMTGVREGEYANAKDTTGLPGSVVAAYNKAWAGSLLTPEQRKQFLNSSLSLYDKEAQQQEKTIENYTGLAQRLSARPENVIVGSTIPESYGLRKKELERLKELRAKNSEGK